MGDTVDDNLLEGIAPKKVEHEVPVPEKEFRGWHKPRKQLVRREQWLREIAILIPNLRLDGKLLRYLTLPGEDMFDIRLLSEFCKRKGLALKPLGFNDELFSITEKNISGNELSDKIAPCSVLVIPDNFSVLKSDRSQGFSYIKEHGPFDVVNLDLCGSISCIEHPDTHQALKNLCQYQVNKRREPWLLFLTTRAEHEQVNLRDLPSYLKTLKYNSDYSSTFATRLTTITGFKPQEYDGGVVPCDLIQPCNGFRFVRLFATGFAKWLLRLMLTSRWTVEMLDSYWYRVEDNQKPESFPNMLSLAFKISPVDIALSDSSGLVTSDPSPEVDEDYLGIAILDKSENLIDIDQKIDRDGALYNELFHETINLLQIARYPVEQYHKWADERKIRFSSN
nr:hypothetical protein 1 [bacterium]